MQLQASGQVSVDSWRTHKGIRSGELPVGFHCTTFSMVISKTVWDILWRGVSYHGLARRIISCLGQATNRSRRWRNVAFHHHLTIQRISNPESNPPIQAPSKWQRPKPHAPPSAIMYKVRGLSHQIPVWEARPAGYSAPFALAAALGCWKAPKSWGAFKALQLQRCSN